jgi:hypothetical protein
MQGAYHAKTIQNNKIEQQYTIQNSTNIKHNYLLSSMTWAVTHYNDHVHGISMSNIVPSKCLYVLLMLLLNKERVAKVVGGNRWAICLSMREENQYGDIY